MANEYSADVPKGFNVPKQVRLDSITGIQNEETLKNLGTGNNLAFKYYENLKVYCKDEKTEYVWREVVGVETGLLDIHFTYPTYTAVDGIDYSGKSFNFFLVLNSGTPANGSETKINSGTNTTVTGLGTIASPYVINSTDTVANGSETKINEGDNVTITGNGTTLTPYIINTDLTNLGIVKTIDNEVIAPGQTLSIINDEITGKILVTKEYVESVIPPTPNGSETKIDAGDNITVTGDGTTLNPYIINSYIEVPVEFEIPSLIVNSDYTGTEELGTASKPFKNLQNALDAYVGNGISNKVPELLGTIIVIKKDINIFTGSLAYAGLNIELQNGVSLITNPSSSNYVIDIDSDAILPTNINYSMIPFSNTELVDITITILEGATLQAQKQLVKNRGTNLSSGNSKSVNFKGKGQIINLEESVITSPSTKNLFSLNEDNQIGFLNGGIVTNISATVNIQSNNSQIIYGGLNSKSYFLGNNIQIGKPSVAFNSNTVPIKLDGGVLVGESMNIINEYNNSPTYSLVNLISVENGAYFYTANGQIGGICEYVFANNDIGSSTTCEVILDKCLSLNNQTEAYFKSFMISGVWNIQLTNCNFPFWGVNDLKIKLIPGSINRLDSQIVETLPIYDNRTAAIIAGLFTGCKFINTGGVVSPTTGWFIDIVI